VRHPTRTFAATVLSFEALIVFFAGLVAMHGKGGLGLTLGVPSALAVACLVVAGMLRRRWGYIAGWLLQIAVVATGVLVPAMYVVGAIFLLLWWYGLRLGRRIERERSIVAQALEQTGADPTTT